MPTDDVANPPVPAVPNAVAKASNTFTPPNNNKTISIAVIAVYIPYKIIDVFFILGTSFPATGPGTSALIRCIEFSFSIGIIISTNTRTPIPPTQCVKLLQKSTPCGRYSGFERTDAPVVVKPETISKSADQ